MRADGHIQCRALMRVFAIAQFGFAISVHGKHIGEQLLLICKSEPLADHAVICCGRRIGFGRTFTAEVIACFAAAFLQLRDQIIIIGWVGQDRDICVVLRGAAHHRRSTDVDILDDVIARGTLRHGLRKGIKVHDDKVDCANVMFFHRRCVFGIVANGKQSAMHFGMQRFDAAVHHFGKACKLANVLHLKPCITQRLGGTTGGDQFDMARGQSMSKFNQSRLVRNGQ